MLAARLADLAGACRAGKFDSVLADKRLEVKECLVTRRRGDDRVDRVDTAGCRHSHRVGEAAAGPAGQRHREIAHKWWVGVDLDAVAPGVAHRWPVGADVRAHPCDVVDHEYGLAADDAGNTEADPGDGA